MLSVITRQVGGVNTQKKIKGRARSSGAAVAIVLPRTFGHRAVTNIILCLCCLSSFVVVSLWAVGIVLLWKFDTKTKLRGGTKPFLRPNGEYSETIMDVKTVSLGNR